eukprot:CAMPEP_0202732738 /NCGR_PEP_ID=MMETSP1385-20130828/187814_1 /ASSEMBLY_ACC=CAM_ASM_000861 /TAXON_ID=933848 /ORGANISM="Elphidium margaritaceum" /LENGTH=38 /DNA_ID= /DNA_START= /DNA_END= /DNA_ORIENTATION=
MTNCLMDLFPANDVNEYMMEAKTNPIKEHTKAKIPNRA